MQDSGRARIEAKKPRRDFVRACGRGLRSLSILCTPGSWMLMADISGCGEGSMSVTDVVSSLVKTDENCSLRMSALTWLSL